MEFADYLDVELINLSLSGTKKKEVLWELVELLAKENKIDSKDEFYQAILEREEEGSTGLGHGVALPHGKSEAVNELAVAIGISPAGIDFDSLDKKPTKLFFMIADSTGYSENYLQIVSTLSSKLRKKALRKKLMAADSRQEIIEIMLAEEE
jgi:fructose-specific phosphotransferase system IIA component